MTSRLYAGLFMASGFGGLAIMTVGAGLQESRVTLAGFALVAVAIVVALDSIRRNGLAGTGGERGPMTRDPRITIVFASVFAIAAVFFAAEGFHAGAIFFGVAAPAAAVDALHSKKTDSGGETDP